MRLKIFMDIIIIMFFHKKNSITYQLIFTSLIAQKSNSYDNDLIKITKKLL